MTPFYPIFETQTSLGPAVAGPRLCTRDAPRLYGPKNVFTSPISVAFSAAEPYSSNGKARNITL